MGYGTLETPSAPRIRIMVALTIGLGGTVLAVLNIAGAPAEIKARPLALILAPQVSAMIVTAVLGYLSALGPRLRSLQVWVLLANGYLAAALSGPGNLTAFVLVLLAVLLGGRYGVFDAHPRRRVGAALLGYLVFAAVGMTVVRPEPPAIVAATLAGATIVGIITWAVVIHWLQERERREEQLEERVARRTRDLREAIEKEHVLLEDQRALLAELHHRTKNNLQIVSSILSLGTGQSSSSAALQTRIAALARIHDRLYASTGRGTVDFGGFLQSYLRDVQSMIGSEFLQVSLNAIDLPEVPSDLALRFGIALNEIAVEAVNRAATSGKLHVEAAKQQGILVVDIEETPGGAGSKRDASGENGTALVEAMMHTVGGTVRRIDDGRTRWHLTAPLTYGRGRWDSEG